MINANVQLPLKMIHVRMASKCCYSIDNKDEAINCPPVNAHEMKNSQPDNTRRDIRMLLLLITRSMKQRMIWIILLYPLECWCGFLTKCGGPPAVNE